MEELEKQLDNLRKSYELRLQEVLSDDFSLELELNINKNEILYNFLLSTKRLILTSYCLVSIEDSFENLLAELEDSSMITGVRADVLHNI